MIIRQSKLESVLIKTFFFVSLILPFFFGSLVLAHSDVKDKNVIARMLLMSDMASNMRVIGKMMKNPTGFDIDRATQATLAIAELARQTPSAFQKEAKDPSSEAKAEIWTEFANFKALSQTLMDDATTAANLIATAQDLRPTLVKLSRSCKSCHSQYRE